MPNFKEAARPSARMVEAIQVNTHGDENNLRELLAFFQKSMGSVDILDHPPRIKMSHDGRGFTAYEGDWVVKVIEGAYLKMGNTAFEARFKPVED